MLLDLTKMDQKINVIKQGFKKTLIVTLLRIFLINLNLLSIYKNLKICVMNFFELKNKFRRLRVKNKNEQKIVGQLSSCLIEKYSGFTQISLENKKKAKKAL